MKKILYATVLGAFVAAGLSMCKPADAAAGQQYVSVRDGEFYIGDSVYRYVGANFWYGAILASEGRGGDRARLAREDWADGPHRPTRGRCRSLRSIPMHC